MDRLAAIDLGSLTVRLALAERTGPGSFRVLSHRREITGLGEGLAQTGALAPGARERTLAALAGFVREMEAFGAAHRMVVGTQALRQAINREAFLAALAADLGLTVRLLSPEEEARLTLKGVLSVLAPEFLAAEALVVFDVGGGSSEFVLLRPGTEPRFAGLPLGVLTLSQARPLGDPPEPERVAALKQELSAELGGFFQTHFRRRLSGPPLLVGTAGAVTSLAAMALKMMDYAPRQINNFILRRIQVAEMAARLSSLPESHRARLPGLEAGKAGVMPAGALIVLTILEVFGQDSLVVVDAGLLEGVLSQLAA